MYKSPIDLLVADIQHQLVKQQEEDIYQAVVKCGVHVDKQELIRALQYDRRQYDKGYADGKRDAMENIVHCKDCKHQRKTWISDKRRKDKGYFVYGCENEEFGMLGADDDFCSYGERRTDNG